MIRQALRSALSDRAALERVVLVNDWGFEIPKTKMAVAALGALGLEGRVLVVLGYDDVVAERSFGNLQRIQTVQVGELNTYDVLRNDWIVFTDESLPGGVGDISSHKLPEDVEVSEDLDAATTDVPEQDAPDATDADNTDADNTGAGTTDTEPTDEDTEPADADAVVSDESVDSAVPDHESADEDADEETEETES